MSMFSYMYICVHVSISNVWVYEHMYAKAKGWHQNIFLNSSPLSFWGRVFHWTWSLPIWLDWLAHKPQELSHLHLLIVGLQETVFCTCVLETEFMITWPILNHLPSLPMLFKFCGTERSVTYDFVTIFRLLSLKSWFRWGPTTVADQISLANLQSQKTSTTQDFYWAILLHDNLKHNSYKNGDVIKTGIIHMTSGANIWRF